MPEGVSNPFVDFRSRRFAVKLAIYQIHIGFYHSQGVLPASVAIELEIFHAALFYMLKVECCFSGIGKIIPQTASGFVWIFQYNITQKYSGDRCSFRPGYTIGVNARTADMAERYIVDRAAAVAVIIHRSSYIQRAVGIEDHVIETYIADICPLISPPAGTDDYTVTGRSHYDITDYSIADFCARAQTDADTRLIGGQYTVAYYNILAVIRLRKFS